MEIIGKPKSAKFVYEDWAAKHLISPHATRKEKDIWWNTEMEYWRKGRFGLTGAQYFF